MAEYVKFRLTAAKVGVTMALAALIAGVAEKAHSNPPPVTAKQAALFIKLNGITGQVHDVLAKIEAKVVKVDNDLRKFEAKVNTVYLRTRDARAEFLIKDATALNSNKLGNLPASAFVQGNRASVITGATTFASASPGPSQLLKVAGGIIAVAITGNTDQAQLTITNRTGGTLPAVQDTDNGGPAAVSMADGSVMPLPTFMLTKGVGQVRLQLMPNAAFRDVVSVLISLTPAGNGQIRAVGQAFTGGV